MSDYSRVEQRKRDGNSEIAAFDRSTVERLELEVFADQVTGALLFPVTRQQALHVQAVFDAAALSIGKKRSVALSEITSKV